MPGDHKAQQIMVKKTGPRPAYVVNLASDKSVSNGASKERRGKHHQG
jgi:hypothetical protein